MFKKNVDAKSDDANSNKEHFTFFTALPNELMEKTLSFLAVSDIESISRTTTEMKSIADDPALWNQKLNELTAFTGFPENITSREACRNIMKHSDMKDNFWNKVCIKNSNLYVLQTPELANKLKNHELQNMIRHPNMSERTAIARCIIENENLANKLDPSSLQFLFVNAEIALAALKNPILVAKMSDAFFKIQGRRFPEVAEYILKNITAFSKCTPGTQEILRTVLQQAAAPGHMMARTT